MYSEGHGEILGESSCKLILIYSEKRISFCHSWCVTLVSVRSKRQSFFNKEVNVTIIFSRALHISSMY